MKVKFKNLGAVKEASIDLTKKLTVLCGPNNTGKTYVSYAIYGIIEGLNNHSYLEDSLFSKENMAALIREKKVSINLDVAKIYKYDFLIEDFKNNLNSLFGISENEIEKIFKNVELSFETSEEEFKNAIFESEFKILQKFRSLEIMILKEKESNTLTLNLLNFKEGKRNFSFISGIMTDYITHYILRYPTPNAHIFPVERSSIYTFSKELSVKRNMLIDEMQRVTDSKQVDPFEWMRKRTTRYPLPIRDGLEIAEDIVNYQKTETEFKVFAEEIEAEILNGKIALNKDGEVVFASNKAKSKKIPIHLSASLVKTLSSIIFYLKHLAKPNDLIIIDEPELNLHPDNQILLTRMFAQLIHKGFRLLISTHSDYIIKEVNNLIMLSGIDKNEEIIKELGYKDTQLLKAADVGAYLFKYPNVSSTKTVVEKLEVTYEGFDVSTIDETINMLNENSMKLYQHISDQKEKSEDE